MSRAEMMQLVTRGDCEIVITRVFDAPREMVFDAHTKPELLKRWMTGSPGWSLEVCEIDLRVGGAFRYVWRGPKGQDMGMGGVHREIVPPERLVTTELFDVDWTGGEVISTLVLTESDGKTTLTNTLLYPSRESRDSVVNSGMGKGMGDGFDQLEDLLLSMSAGGREA
jgi:uncharacterized protein YndB with AHSA1/START domain